MLKKSVYALRYAAVVVIASIVIYIIKPEIGVYFLGLGLISFSIATVLYIVFMFRRYGEKKPIE